MLSQKLEIVNIRNRRLAVIKQRLFISLIESARQSKISKTRMVQLIAEGRVEGAYKVGKQWVIPAEWRHFRRKRGVRRKAKAGPGCPAFSLTDPSRKS